MVFDHSLRVYMTAKKFTKEHTYICYRHTCIHTYIPYKYTYTLTCTYIHTYTHYITYIHTCIHTHTYIHVHDSCWHTWLYLTLNRTAAKGLNTWTLRYRFLKLGTRQEIDTQHSSTAMHK